MDMTNKIMRRIFLLSLIFLCLSGYSQLMIGGDAVMLLDERKFFVGPGIWIGHATSSRGIIDLRASITLPHIENISGTTGGPRAISVGDTTRKSFTGTRSTTRQQLTIGASHSLREIGHGPYVGVQAGFCRYITTSETNVTVLSTGANYDNWHRSARMSLVSTLYFGFRSNGSRKYFITEAGVLVAGDGDHGLMFAPQARIGYRWILD
jgi:hypothetical protein